MFRASRYLRYDPDRRSRSPRDRSPPDRFDMDRRRPSVDLRPGTNTFQSNRDNFGDGPRREPPRGPRALIDAPNGPRGGGFGGDFRGGRGRGRGRGWSSRDESRDRGRDRDVDFRDRFRDDRSRERERDREWRGDPYRSRRSPIGRPRSPPLPRDFRDRERDGPVGPDLTDRPRRNSRDGPLPGGSPSAEMPFGLSPSQRGGFMGRGRGRGGRGDWNSDRNRGRLPFDDRTDRYPRSRSQEGRWGRNRDDRDRLDRVDRIDRYPEMEVRRQVDDRGDNRELFREKMQARAAIAQDTQAPTKETSPPPPMAPPSPVPPSTFGSLPPRSHNANEASPTNGPGAGKPPPTAPRAFADTVPPRPEASLLHTGPSKMPAHDNQPIPVGPRAQQQKPQRPSSKQWINPNLKKAPDSPQMMRQSLQPRAGPFHRDGAQRDHCLDDPRPSSSDSKMAPDLMDPANRRRTRRPSEPGEIFSKSEDDWQATKHSWDEERSRPDLTVTKPAAEEPAKRTDALPEPSADTTKRATRKRKRPIVNAIRFSVPSKPQPAADKGSESDDDEDMADYFADEMEKVQSELSKLQGPKLPREVVARYAAMSHGAMVKILNERDGLMEMLGKSETLRSPTYEPTTEPKIGYDEVVMQEAEPAHQEPQVVEAVKVDEEKVEEPKKMTRTGPEDAGTGDEQPQPDVEEMDVDSVREEASSPLPTRESSPPSPPVEPPKETPTAVVDKAQLSAPSPKTMAADALSEATIIKLPSPSPETVEPKARSPPPPTVSRPTSPEPPISPKQPVSPKRPASPKESPLPTHDVTAEPMEIEVEIEAKAEVETEDQAEADIDAEAETEVEVDAEGEEDAEGELELDSKHFGTTSRLEDNGDETETDNEAMESVGSVTGDMDTPPVESLPKSTVGPWNEDEEFVASLADDPGLDDYILAHLETVHLEKTEEQQRDQQIYREKYMTYLEFTSSDDPTAKRSREKLAVPGAPSEVVGAINPEPKPEGRTSGRRFASERDLERVLQASMREEDERKERELRMQKEKYRGDKEAVIPDMYWNAQEKEEKQYLDRAGYVPPHRLVREWKVLPPSNNFTEEEMDLFEKRYLELPKQWGKVAEVIPNRTFGTCIQYYYLMKKELNLKEKLKKQPKKRKKGGRGKGRSSALVSELGNGEPEADETPNETGENGENRRRPRRAAAPTWNFEQPPIESENGTPASTPSRRGGAIGGGKGEQPEKVDGRKGRKKAAKEKEPKLPKQNQAIAAAPGPGTGRAKGRLEQKGQNTEFQAVLPMDQQRQQQSQQQVEQHKQHIQQQQHIQPHQQHATQLQQLQQLQPQHPRHQQQPLQHQQQHASSGIQPPFPIQQSPYQPTLQSMERPQPHISAVAPITDVITAPSLRPEPPAPPPAPPQQPAMATFNVVQPQQERKVPTQASSYWSVSEANDFPHLLKAFGSDWNAIAAHMGSKTPVMVKNYYVRQKGKSEWEDFVNEADAKRTRGEKRPEPPQPSVGGRGRRYDLTPASMGSRPLAAAPEPLNEQPQPKPEPGQAQRGQPFMPYGVPIAQGPPPSQQQQQQPVLASSAKQPLGIQQQAHPHPHSQPQVQSQPPLQPQPPQPPQQVQQVQQVQQAQKTPAVKAIAQAISPPALRAPLDSFAFPRHGEREQASQRVPLAAGPKPSSAPVDPRDQRQPLHQTQPDAAGDRQRIELQAQRERSNSQRERMERDLERERERGRQSMRPKQEVEMKPQPQPQAQPPPQPQQHHRHHHYDTFGHHQSTGPREPLSISRHQEPTNRQDLRPELRQGQGAPPSVSPYPASHPHPHHSGGHAASHPAGHPMRTMLSDAQPTQSPPLGPPVSRPISSLQHQRHLSGSAPDLYRSSSPAPATASAPTAPPGAAASASRPAPEPSKRSNIMSLLNDDPPPPPKRVSDVPANNPRPSPTPPPTMARPSPGAAPPSQLRREADPYSPYSRVPPRAASAMPSLKPSPAYTASPGSQHGGARSSLGMAVDPPASDRDYYRQHPYSQGHPSGHPPSATNSPQTTPSHRYTASGGPGTMYQTPSGYPTSYGSASQPPNAASPSQQYAMQGSSSSRPREVSQGGGDSWSGAGHSQPSSGWATPQPANSAQHAPPPLAPHQHQQSWGQQHPSSKANTSTASWATGPSVPTQQPQQPHLSTLRDERGAPKYGSSAGQQEQHRREQQHREQQHREQQHREQQHREQQHREQQNREQQHREQQQHMQARYGPPPSRGPEPVPPPSQAYPRYASTPGPGNQRDPRDIPQRSYTPSGYPDARGPPPPGSGYPGPPDPREMQLRDSTRDHRDPRELRDPRDPREMMARGLRPHEYDRQQDHYGR